MFTRCVTAKIWIFEAPSKQFRSSIEAPDPTDFDAPLKIQYSKLHRSNFEAPDRTDFEAPSKLTERDHFIILGCDGLWGVSVEKFPKNRMLGEREIVNGKFSNSLQADGEALMNLSRTLLTSVKSHIGGGVTPSDFISCLLRDFTKVQGRKGTSDFEAAHKNSILWKEIGHFQEFPRVLGPMQTEVKQRNVAVYRKRAKQTESSQPQQLGNTGAEEKRTDTDENMLTMFDILKSKRRVKLESLILNRKSFAQTVENLFALSFLVKDGRVIMAVDEKGSHLRQQMLLTPLLLCRVKLLTAILSSDMISRIGRKSPSSSPITYFHAKRFSGQPEPGNSDGVLCRRSPVLR
ncbi:hypothetical protein HYC85_012572 [Camellia sinensis]|uniref:Non-structural maintenance of chromosomes element 4 n=1 Tax=Camellia sinensis TaxID=4442 RepID=A0A7J7HCW9_CAMSI|nr:hypothetical protein HYC85_012572 [Camellia sinensis]